MLNIILLYTCIVAIIIFIKPRVFFNEDENLKEFGFREGRTVLPFHLLTPILAILMFTVSMLV